MQKVRYLLVWALLCSSAAEAATFNRPFYDQVSVAIHQYFINTQRKVENIQLGQPRHFEGEQYLIEANVKAQASFGNHIVNYYCGVFFRRAINRASNNSDWSIDFLTCDVRQ